MKLHEPYPSRPEEWENPENTLFREFYITSSHDFEVLERLVEQNMDTCKGNEGILKCRLLHLLRDEKYRAFYLHSQKRKHPYTWRLRWWTRLAKMFLHRKFKTRYFRNQLELCKISSEVVKNFNNKHGSDKTT